jgi:hypothetical protein
MQVLRKKSCQAYTIGDFESLGNEASTSSSDKLEAHSRDSNEFKRFIPEVSVFAACASFPLTLVNSPEFKGVSEACYVRAAKCLPSPNTQVVGSCLLRASSLRKASTLCFSLISCR